MQVSVCVCRVSHPCLIHARSSVKQGEYVGYLAVGLPSGLGVMVYDAGNTYCGQFADGKKNGMGEFRWKNGTLLIAPASLMHTRAR